MRIYVAGPYSAPTEQEREANANRAIDAGIAVVEKGHCPFIPHMNHMWDIRARERGIVYPWDFWLDWCVMWLSKCDGLLFLGESPGANVELDFAKKAGMQIFYSVDEIE